MILLVKEDNGNIVRLKDVGYAIHLVQKMKEQFLNGTELRWLVLF